MPDAVRVVFAAGAASLMTKQQFQLYVQFEQGNRGHNIYHGRTDVDTYNSMNDVALLMYLLIVLAVYANDLNKVTLLLKKNKGQIEVCLEVTF